MKIEILDYEDRWQAVKRAAMVTIGKKDGAYPSPGWKRKILMAEHSPIRELRFTILMEDIPSFVSVHFTRHKNGVEHFVSTQRTDRTGVDRNKLPQDNPITHMLDINAQELIYISRKRLCCKASPETREVWHAVINAVKEHEPELASVCVPECVYRGFCPEMKSCGFAKGKIYERMRQEYVGSAEN